jgi:hypothetical protein
MGLDDHAVKRRSAGGGLQAAGDGQAVKPIILDATAQVLGEN